MMANNDAERLLDEDFIATDDSRLFDRLEEESNRYGDLKYRKKGGFNFVSTWRKPKIGRRKTRSISKTLDTYDMSKNEDSTRGKYVKGRESFDSFASVPLSEFNETKDMLPFMNLRADNSSLRKSVKEKTALNPKMFLAQPPVNRKEIKNKFKKERITEKRIVNEQPRDIFKPIQNKNIDEPFDAFQILPKESPSKVKSKEETIEKPKTNSKAEMPNDLYDKENFSKEAFYCGDLYNDHGPILSSLSEDTLHSDSVRGEQFLEDEIDQKKQWSSLLNSDLEEKKEEKWRMDDVNMRMDVQRAETAESLNPSAKVEITVGSFSDRLKLFQTKNTQQVQKRGSDLIKSNSRKSNTSSKPSTLSDPEVTKYEEEASEPFESKMVPEKSDFDDLEAELENLDKLVASTFSDSAAQASEGTFQPKTINSKSSISSYSSNSSSRNKKSSGVERKYVKQFQTKNEPIALTSTYQADKKNFVMNKNGDGEKKKILVQSSEKVQSKVVDLSMIDSYRNQAVTKGTEKDDSVLEVKASEPSVSLESIKVESKKPWKESSTSNRLHRKSDWSMHSTRSYNSLRSHKITTPFESEKFVGRFSKSAESEVRLSTEVDSKVASSEASSQALEEINSDQPQDNAVSVSNQASLEEDTNIAETKKEKTRDSFMAATMLFGGKVEPSKNKARKMFATNSHKTCEEDNSEEKEETKELQNKDKKTDIFSSGQDEPINTSKSPVFGTKISLESVRSKAGVENITRSSNEAQKVVRKSSLASGSKTTKTGRNNSSLETGATTINAPDAASLESPDEAVVPKPVTSNESTGNTSVSSLTCDSVVPTSFAQQSASIFGVTLSKRKKKIESAPSRKEPIASKDSVELDTKVKKPEAHIAPTETQTTKPTSDVAESKAPVNEEQNVCGKGHNGRILSSSSSIIKGVDKKMETASSDTKQEERPTEVEQLLQTNQNEQANHLNDDERDSDDSNPKLKQVSVPRKVKTRSISDRLKMFEKTNERRKGPPKKIIENMHEEAPKKATENALENVSSDSPKSVGTSGSSSSFDDLSVATRRRDTGSGITTVADADQNQQAQIESSPSKTEDNNNESNESSYRRKTLKSNRGTIVSTTSLKPQPKSSVVEKVEIIRNNEQNSYGKNTVGTDNGPKDSSKNMPSETKEELDTKPHESLSKGDAYSMRRKFFENLDRKRMQASMSKPLVTQTESMPGNSKSRIEHEIETVTDETNCEDNDLPMFVEVEEDFMLRDNISTCLSASENRSVICKPDALLYSVSQKAIALMSAKAENNSMRSYSRTYGTENKGTIDNGLKFNGEESSSKFRNHFARKTATCGEKDAADQEPHEEGAKDKGVSLENQPENKFRGSKFSQRHNRFEGTTATAESCNESNDEKAVASTYINVANDRKTEPSIENGASTEKRTTSSFNQSNYNSFATKKMDYGTKTGQRSTKGDVADNVANSQDGNNNSTEKAPATTTDEKDKPAASKKKSSMSIRERLKLFEAESGKSSAAFNKPAKEEPKVPENARKSSVSVLNRYSGSNNVVKTRPSVGSEATPLAGETIASHSEPSVSETSHSRKRASSTSMGTLDYSLQSSSCSRPSDTKKRVSSASSNTNGPSAAQLYRNALSSAKSRQGKTKTNLRRF